MMPISKFHVAGALALLGSFLGYRSMPSQLAPSPTNPTVRVFADHKLIVEVERQVGCELGDMNVIVDHLAKLQRPKLLFTVESLAPNSSFKPISLPISLSALNKGKITNAFKLNGGDSDHDLGIFLCSDGSGTNSCLGKVPLDMAQASFMTTDRSRETLAANKQVDKKSTADAVFFFQYGRLGDESLRLIMGPSGAGREEAARQMAANGVTKIVDEMLSKTTSMALAVAPLKQETIARLPLKFFEHKACERQSLREHRDLVEQETRLRKKRNRTAKTH